MYICICKGVTDSQIKQVVDEGASSMRDVCDQLDVCRQCGKCAAQTKSVITERLSQSKPTSSQ